MPFADLEHMSLADYVAREAQRPGLWFFQHIPKTAGSSFATELEATFPPYRNVEVQYSHRSINYDEELRQATFRFNSDYKTNPFKSASGHVPGGLLQRIREAIPQARFITFLRDPVSRVISEYRYQRTSDHPPYLDFIERYPTFEEYFEAPESQNQMAKFLTRHEPDLTIEEVISAIRSNYSFVGVVEAYALSFNSMFAAMGSPNRFPIEYQRRTKDTERNQVTITPQIERRIESLNLLDLAAFSFAQKLLASKRVEWAISPN